MIQSLLYIFLGLGVITLLYKLQYISEDKKEIEKREREITENIIIKNNIKKSENQNLSTKYNIGTYRDKKGRFRSLKTLVND